MTTELWAIGLVISATIVGAIGPILLKKGSDKFYITKLKEINFNRIIQNILDILKNKSLIFGLGFYALSTLLFIPALKGGELSVLYPLVALSYVWVTFLSKWILREEITRLKWLGVLFILIGVSLIGLGS